MYSVCKIRKSACSTSKYCIIVVAAVLGCWRVGVSPLLELQGASPRKQHTLRTSISALQLLEANPSGKSTHPMYAHTPPSLFTLPQSSNQHLPASGSSGRGNCLLLPPVSALPVPVVFVDPSSAAASPALPLAPAPARPAAAVDPTPRLSPAAAAAAAASTASLTVGASRRSTSLAQTCLADGEAFFTDVFATPPPLLPAAAAASSSSSPPGRADANAGISTRPDAKNDDHELERSRCCCCCSAAAPGHRLPLPPGREPDRLAMPPSAPSKLCLRRLRRTPPPCLLLRLPSGVGLGDIDLAVAAALAVPAPARAPAVAPGS